MKFFIVVALALAGVMAEPEADASAHYYGGYAGYGLGYGGYASYGYGYPYATYGHRYIGKREAEPEADASALYYAATPYAYNHFGYSSYAAPLAYTSSIYGAYPYASTYGRRFIGKREAEAEPEADASALYYAATPYAYNHFGYSSYAAPLAYTSSIYGAYPYASTYGHRFIGKREAEPEADASSFYGGYGYAYGLARPYGYGYSSYAAFRPSYGYGYGRYF